MIRFIIFSGWFTSFGISQVDVFDSFLRFLHQDGGVQMNIRYHQEQFGESYKLAGAFYFLEDDYYIFDSHDQRIVVNGDSITTINKQAKQIIYDLTIPGNVTIFDILTGDMEGIKREPAILDKSGYKIMFTVPGWELSGLLRLKHGSGHPTAVELNAGEGQGIRIRILSAEPLLERGVPDLDMTYFDVIDLRE